MIRRRYLFFMLHSLLQIRQLVLASLDIHSMGSLEAFDPFLGREDMALGREDAAEGSEVYFQSKTRVNR